MGLEFWAWLTVAAIMLAGEVLSPGFFMLPFGLGALGAVAASAFAKDPAWQWIAFVGISSVLMIVFQRFVVRRKDD